MNIFFLSANPAECAAFHCDKHVVKMCVEYRQILSTVQRQGGIVYEGQYRTTHANHPCVKWAGDNADHYSWLWRLLVELGEEYARRYSRLHASCNPIQLSKLRDFPYDKNRTDVRPPPLCMPDECKVEYASTWQAVRDSYRNYYKREKAYMATWRNGAPKWWNV